MFSNSLDSSAARGEETETTLLVHPWVLNDFLDFNDFLGAADALVEDLDLDGVLQVASFHPDYQFEGTDADDVDNFSNRSPYPTLHLLREESIERAVETMPDTDAIYEANIDTLRRIGRKGWDALDLEAKLPLAQRSAFLLHHDDGLALADVAHALEVGFETAKTRLRYAMAKLRACMGAYLAPESPR